METFMTVPASAGGVGAGHLDGLAGADIDHALDHHQQAGDEEPAGRQVMFGPNCVVVDSDFHAHWPPEARATEPGMEGDRPVNVGDYAWIGMNCLILKGVSIGEGAIIGAGSVVTRDVPPFCLAAGSPARVLRCLKPGETPPADAH